LQLLVVVGASSYGMRSRKMMMHLEQGLGLARKGLTSVLGLGLLFLWVVVVVVG
jgi:hypothetical protein